MAKEAIELELQSRATGRRGGMPVGACISEQTAIAKWEAGERSYFTGSYDMGDGNGPKFVDLGEEPLFVSLNKDMQFTTTEMTARYAGSIYKTMGEELGLQPFANGIKVTQLWPSELGGCNISRAG